MERWTRWLPDNPLFLKHVRSRLRRPLLVPALTLVLVLCGLIVWWGVALNRFVDGGAAQAAYWLQLITLGLVGGSQVSQSVSSARESGILDFHRISPLRPSSIALGFFFGGPIREYLLALLPLPILIASAMGGTPSFLDVLQGQLALLMFAWLFHVGALLSALISRRPSKSGAGILIVGLIVVGNIFTWLGTAGSGDPFSDEEGRYFRFFGVALPWLLWVAIYALPLIGFGLLASTRKMRSERAHMLSKPQAVGFMAMVSVLLLGATLHLNDMEFIDMLVLYALGGCALMTSMTIVPTAGEYAKGVRRALREERGHLSVWDDLALNRVALAALCLVVLVSATVLVFYGGRAEPRSPHLSLGVAVLVLTIAYFGLAHQFFALVASGRALTLLGLSVFLLWVVPLLAAFITGSGGGFTPVTEFLLALTPVYGIGVFSGSGSGVSRASDVARIAALIPAIGLPFLLNNLVTVYRRRIDKAVAAGGMGDVTQGPRPELG